MRKPTCLILIAAAAFAVDFGERCLSFDTTDANADGIPDAIKFSALLGNNTMASDEFILKSSVDFPGLTMTSICPDAGPGKARCYLAEVI